MVIEAGVELTLKAGGSFIKIDPSGVTITGANIRLNSGGSPGQGTPAEPGLPALPAHAELDSAGETTGRAASNLPVAESNQKTGLEQLIVDVWGDPAFGGQVQLLDPEDKQ